MASSTWSLVSFRLDRLIFLFFFFSDFMDLGVWKIVGHVSFLGLLQ